jgi:transposase
MFVERKSLNVECRECKIGVRTANRWLKIRQVTGSFMPLRRRKSIPGVMTQDDQDILCSINARHRTLYHDELARHLFQATGNCYSARQIRQCMFRKGYVYKKASHLAPIERDSEFRRFWREQVIYPGGAIRAEHLLFVDEPSKKLRNCFRNNVHCVAGDSIEIPVQVRNQGNSASIIASMSIEGIQSVTAIDIAADGTINADIAFEYDFLTTCQPWPGKRSIVVLDNAAVHMKHCIDALCFAKGVIAIYLPPYSFDYNPIELVGRGW